MHEITPDAEAELLAKQIMDVSPRQNSPEDDGRKSPLTQLKDEIKESIHQEDFFINKTDLPGTELPNPFQQSSKIKIENFADPVSQTQISSAQQYATSPLSQASSAMVDDKGCMSLDSSLASGENHRMLQNVIKEVQNEIQDEPTDPYASCFLAPQQREMAERMTDEFLKLILAELGNDFEVLVSRDRI